MPAKIAALQDSAIRKIVQIEKPMSRVGGAPPCDIVFPGLPPHVFSLEYHEKAYWIQNTGNETLFLEENVIPCGSQMAWESGETLQVGKLITLRLDLDKDPRPQPVGRTFMGIRPVGLLTEDEKSERQHQIKLLAMLAVIVAGILFFSSQIILNKPDQDRHVRREFERVIKELEDQKFNLINGSANRLAMEKELADLIAELKRARIAQLDKKLETSTEHFSSIRDHLRKRYITEAGTFSPEIFGNVHDFAWSQMVYRESE